MATVEQLVIDPDAHWEAFVPGRPGAITAVANLEKTRGAVVTPTAVAYPRDDLDEQRPGSGRCVVIVHRLTGRKFTTWEHNSDDCLPMWAANVKRGYFRRHPAPRRPRQPRDAVTLDDFDTDWLDGQRWRAWLDDARVGDVWALTIDGHEAAYVLDRDGTYRGSDGDVASYSPTITAGRHIWRQ